MPADDDEYARLVRRAESGDENIDFLAMRHAWLKSAAYKRASFTERDRLRKELAEAVNARDNDGVRDAEGANQRDVSGASALTLQ